MRPFTELLNNLTSGVYWLPSYPDSDDHEDFFNQKTWICYYIDGNKAETERQMVDLFQDAMQFPYDCLGDFDAFRDCVRSLPWYAGGFERYVIFYNDFHVFAEKNRERFDLIIQEVFEPATDNWLERRPDKRLNILLFGDESILPESVIKLDK